MKDTSYRQTVIGPEVFEYLRVKAKRLTPATQRDYESCLDKLCRHFTELELVAFEPPAGGRLIERFMAERWGDRAPRTYNKNLSVVHDFFEWEVRRGNLRGDPTVTIERARPRAIYRTTFDHEQRARIMAVAGGARDRVALRLLLDYGIRKGALQGVRFEHFDHERRRLVIFTKGKRVHQVPIPDEGFWRDVDELLADPAARPSHYLLCRQKVVSRRGRARTLTEALDQRLADVVQRARRVDAEIATPDAHRSPDAESVTARGAAQEVDAPPSAACSTGRTTSRRRRCCSVTRRSAPRPTTTSAGRSTSWPRRCATCSTDLRSARSADRLSCWRSRPWATAAGTAKRRRPSLLDKATCLALCSVGRNTANRRRTR